MLLAQLATVYKCQCMHAPLAGCFVQQLCDETPIRCLHELAPWTWNKCMV